jgi:Flp pilus assembly pilin Flp
VRGIERQLRKASQERGQTMAEYALIMALICGSCMAVMMTFQNSVVATAIERVTTVISGL